MLSDTHPEAENVQIEWRKLSKRQTDQLSAR